MAHANESLYVVHGRGLHKLDADCSLQSTVQLPAAAPYNGVLALSDGTLVTKSVGVGGTKGTLALLDADTLALIATYDLPEVAFGRISIGTDGAAEHVYVVGNQTIFRYRYVDHGLTVDPTWSANYHRFADGEQGFGWAACLAGGYAWFLDNGNTRLGANPQAGSSGPLHLIRVSTSDSADIDLFAPFDLPRGGIVSPPLYDEQRGLAVAYDSVNRRLAALEFRADRPYVTRWQHDYGTSAHSVLFDNGLLAVNDFHDGQDDVVVVDIETGEERGRVSTGSPNPSGLWLTAGWDNDVYYTSGSVVARVFAE